MTIEQCEGGWSLVASDKSSDDRVQSLSLRLKILITTLVASDPALKKKAKMLLSACDQTYEAAAAASAGGGNADVEVCLLIGLFGMDVH